MYGMMPFVKNFYVSKEIVSKPSILLSIPPTKWKFDTAHVTTNSGKVGFFL
jgi:hypothetical protein